MSKKNNVEKETHLRNVSKKLIKFRRLIDYSLEEMREAGAYILIPLELFTYAEQNKKEYVNSYCKILDIFLEDVNSRKISSSDAEIITRNIEYLVDSKLQKYPDVRRELKKMRKEKEQEFNLLGIYVSEEESKKMDERHKLVEGLLDLRDKAVAEKEKEIIFNMFSEGLDDEIISKCSSSYSVEDISKLREEWQETNSLEKLFDFFQDNTIHSSQLMRLYYEKQKNR